MRTLLGAGCVLAMAVAVLGLGAARASGLAPGDRGPRVKILQVRVAGWFPASRRQVHFALDGVYGPQTVAAVRAFQRHYGLRADGIAGPATKVILRRLSDADGSTAHFNFSEFSQNHNPACSAQANAYARSFRGGMVSRQRTRRNVRRLMWRLEALRAKGGGHPLGINSGFRSVAYNSCIGGARLSQHMYGTAADNRFAKVSNHRARFLAKGSELHGIGCYSSLRHNHFDVRIDNADLDAARAWWWPRQDGRGRDLDASGRPCWGETRRARVAARVESTSLLASMAEIKAWAAAGEPRHLGAAD